MPTLTRRRERDRQAEHWLIFADDIHIGSIGCLFTLSSGSGPFQSFRHHTGVFVTAA
jgi:hypothetical protein